jgi:hypothetical protein
MLRSSWHSQSVNHMGMDARHPTHPPTHLMRGALSSDTSTAPTPGTTVTSGRSMMRAVPRAATSFTRGTMRL